MTTIARTDIRTRRTSALEILAAATQPIARFIAHVHKRRDLKVLRRMDAHQLRDIGLTPGDVDFALSQPFAEDPSQTLQRLTTERRQAERAMVRESHQGFITARNRSAGGRGND